MRSWHPLVGLYPAHVPKAGLFLIESQGYAVEAPPVHGDLTVSYTPF